MIERDTIYKGIVNRADALKRIRMPKTGEESISTIVEGILNKIEVINSLPEFSEMLWNKRLSEIVIADEWKDLILPESVRMDPTDLKTNNLLIKGSALVSSDIQDYSDFLDLQMKFRGLFKKDLKDNTTTLDQLFVPKSLYDVLPIAAMWDEDDEKIIVNEDDSERVLLDVRSIDDPFIPVRLDARLKCLFRRDYLNTTSKQVIMDYFSKVRF